MASNSASTALNPYNYTLSCWFNENPVTQDHINRNVTNINAYGKLQANGTYWATNNPSKLILYWYDNHQKINREVGSVEFRGLKSKNDYAQVSINFDAEHNDDGTLAGNLWCQFIKGSTTSGFAPNNGDVSTSTTQLITIPRATVCPNISGVVKGPSVNISLNPATQNFKHSIKVEFGSIKGFLNANGNVQPTEVILTSTSPIINFGKEYYSQFAGKNGTGKLIVNTYNGSNLIGSKTGTLVVEVDANKCKPSATGTVKDINPTTIALTGNPNVIVRGYSTAEIIPTYQPSDIDDTGTTIKKKFINNTEFTTDNVQVVNALTKDFDLSLINSREIDAVSTLSAVSLLNYIKVSMNAKFERSSSVSDDMQVSFVGNFFDDYFDEAKTKKNNLSISWKVREKGTEEYTLGGNIAASNYTISNNEFRGEDIPLVNPLSTDGLWDPAKGYDFMIHYSDLLVSDDYKESIKRSSPYFYWYADKNGENHLVALDHLDVKGITTLMGDLYYGDTPIITTIEVPDE